MGKSYKQFYCHNTKLVEKKGWPTPDKKGAVIIEDTKNGFHFEIVFGKKPSVSVYKRGENGNLYGTELLEEIFEKRIIELFEAYNKNENKPKKKIAAKYKGRYNDIDDFFNKA